MSARLQNALRSRGYTELGFYPIPSGFAMVTRMEGFNADGSPRKRADQRWVIGMPAARFSLHELIDRLLHANPGHYRIIVFVVTPTPLTQSTASVSPDDVELWFEHGWNVLPTDLARQPYTPECNTTALIYEFEQVAGDRAPTFKQPSLLTGKEHLQQAGILTVLET